MAMNLALTIDKASPVPIYRQIVLEVTRQVQEGLLASGDALPSERELAESLGIARGTVARAYDELTRIHILESAAGRGSRVSARQDVVAPSRKDAARKTIHEAVSALLDLRFTPREIRTLFDLVLMEREARRRQLCIATIDCNPEALTIFHRQLGFLAGVLIRAVPLETARRPDAARQLAAFDLILTTSTHHEELIGRCPELKDRILRTVVSPSAQTVMDLASLRPSQRIGIVTESVRFDEIIRRTLADFAVAPARLASARLDDTAGLLALVKDRDVLIVPPNCPLIEQPGLAPALQAFTQRGGRIVPFAYQIERGSLLHVEERIRDLMARAPATEAGT